LGRKDRAAAAPAAHAPARRAAWTAHARSRGGDASQAPHRASPPFDPLAPRSH
jgi:hypothetical protein